MGVCPYRLAYDDCNLLEPVVLHEEVPGRPLGLPGTSSCRNAYLNCRGIINDTANAAPTPRSTAAYSNLPAWSPYSRIYSQAHSLEMDLWYSAVSDWSRFYRF